VADAPTEREGEGAWTRLRRRKVVQWGIAYAAAAWTLLQVLEYFGETYAWPRAIRQIAGLAFPLGWLFVLVLAWYHGDKGAQRVSRFEFAILATIVVLAGGTLWWYVSRIDERAWVADTAVPDTKHRPPADAASIAVLPFADMSPGKDQEYFADGIAEELLNLLAQIPQLRVISRSSAFSYKGKDAKITDVAHDLNVAHILEGSVRKAGNKVRITVQLIDARSDTHVWAQTYERPMNDIFAVQDEIAAAVVEQMKLKLLGAPPKAQTTNPEAYTLAMQARFLGRQGTAEALEQSVLLYQRALAIDPDYAAAWVGLGRSYGSQVVYRKRPPVEGNRLAREAVGKALAIEPDIAEAYAVLGWIAMRQDLDLAAAANHLARGIAIDRSSPDVLRASGALANALGRYDEAMAIAQYALARDPVSPSSAFNLGLAYQRAGHMDEAIAAYRAAQRLSPAMERVHVEIGFSLLMKGETDAALAEMRLEPRAAYRLSGLAFAHHALGHHAQSDAALQQLINEYGQDEMLLIANVLAFRGEADNAFGWLEKALERGDPNLYAVASSQLRDKLHDDPRWLPFLRKVGVAPEQLAAIKFDVMLPK
jgi:TolB-like protein/Tfp pilus assembly protein PilF